jgi:DNA-binding NarL/FixJ family response regulator
VTQSGKIVECEVKPLSSIWISCPYPVVTLGLEKMLEAKFRVYEGQEPPVDEAPSSIIYCPIEGDIGSEEVKRLRARAPDAAILVLGLRADTQLARTALLAGADTLIHLRMQPALIICALSMASEGETLVPRDLLEAFLVEMVSRADLTITPRQREFLELVVVTATSRGEIVVPRKLLEAFLR